MMFVMLRLMQDGSIGHYILFSLAARKNHGTSSLKFESNIKFEILLSDNIMWVQSKQSFNNFKYELHNLIM